MSNWAFVTIAYVAVWGGLAVYALVLARRVTIASRVARVLRRATEEGNEERESESSVCDTQRVP